MATKSVLVLFLICLVFNSLAQVNLKNGVIACYQFSGNADDGSGNENHGVVSGPTLTTDRFGAPASAYLFDGGDRIEIPSAPIVNHREISISTWARVSSNPDYGEAQMVVSIGDSDSPYFYGQTLTHHYSSADFTGWGIGGANKNLISTAAFTNVLPAEQTWYHLVLTIEEDYVTMYINGVKTGQTSTGGLPVYFYQRPQSVAYIGMRSMGIQGFQGAIDDIIIYDRAITQDEITELFQNGSPCGILSPVVADVSICDGQSATLVASGGTMYRWYDAAMNGNLLFEGPVFIASVTSTTEFYVANVEGNIESNRTKVVVQVHPQPVLTCSFPDSGLQFEPVTFSATVSSGTPPFTWTFDMGDQVVVTSSKPELIYAYQETGEFTVSVAVSDANGCTAQCANEIVMRVEDLFIPNVITANGDADNDLFTVYSISDEGSTVYQGTRSFSMFIYNRWGEQIYYSEKPADGWSGVEHASGVYFYHIVLGEDRFRGTVSVMK
jgi:hypothetical protein